MKGSPDNIRYLLWRAGVPRRDWSARLVEIIGCDEGRARELLMGRGEALLQGEAAQLAKALKAENARQVLTEDLLAKSGTEILTENLGHLIGGLPHGGKKDFAAAIGVDATTVSRWRGGSNQPSRGKMAEIAAYFGLPADIDLEKDPVFLSLEPLTEKECREWLQTRIDRLDRKTLREIMPALRRLFDGGAGG